MTRDEALAIADAIGEDPYMEQYADWHGFLPQKETALTVLAAHLRTAYWSRWPLSVGCFIMGFAVRSML